MWRWIAIILILIVVALAGTCYAGYRRLTSGGDTLVTMVPGTPARTFTMLTDRDSLQQWLAEGSSTSPAGHGTVRVGDTIRVAQPTTRAAASGRGVQVWIVREVKAPDVLGIEGIEFDPGGMPHPAFTRRDSLSAVRDSTRIVSTFVGVPLATRFDTTVAVSGGVRGRMLNAADRLRLGASRLLWKNELDRLARRGSR